MKEKTKRSICGVQRKWKIIWISDSFTEIIKPQIKHLISKWTELSPNKMRIFVEALTIDVRVKECRKQYEETGIAISFDEAVKVVLYEKFWSPLPFNRAKGRKRPKNILPYIYDYEIESCYAKRDKIYLKSLIKRSTTEKLAWDALQFLLNTRRDSGKEISDELCEWVFDVAGGRLHRPKKGREQTTKVSDKWISNVVQKLEDCGMNKTESAASGNGKTACHAVAKALNLNYGTVVKAVSRARPTRLEDNP